MVDEVLALTFAGGKRLQNTISATAGNVVTNLAPATGKRWKILRGIIDITADANAANRYILLRITDGTDLIEKIYQSAVITAGLTKQLNFGEMVLFNAGTAGDGFGYVGIQNLIIESPDQFRVQISGGLAGDSYEGFVVVLEL